MIIQLLSLYREVIHYWVQPKVKNIKPQPLSKMVTGLVVMTQSGYIAHGKQGQEYSRPEKGCRVKDGNSQPRDQTRMWNSTFQMKWKRTAKERPVTNKQELHWKSSLSDSIYKFCFCAPKLLLPLSLALLAEKGSVFWPLWLRVEIRLIFWNPPARSTLAPVLP